MPSAKIFVPLGIDCFPAITLNKMNLRKEAYPFDYTYLNNDFKIVIKIINDDFNKFLDKQYYIENKDSNGIIRYNHTYYCENMFPHKNVLSDTDYNYYVRTVDRFKKLYFSSEKILFLSTIFQFDIIYNDCIDLYNTMKQKVKNFDMLVIIVRIRNKEEKIEHTKIFENLEAIVIYTQIDDFNKIFTNDFNKQSKYVMDYIKENYM